MKLGLGLYRHMLTRDGFRFAKQAGATDLVVHYSNYFRQDDSLDTASGEESWGFSDKSVPLWTYEELSDLRKAINAEGMELAALENFEPGFWYDILLDGPRKQEQMENLKRLIRDMGRAGIPCMGYNFSIAGVWGRVSGNWARGNAGSVGFLGPDGPEETPIPKGMVWNMIYDNNAPAGNLGEVTHEELWERVTYFLRELVPVAEEAGVMLAAHPDDPPMPTLRNTARLVYQPRYYDKLLELAPSPSNGIELCIGSIAEMTEGDIYEAVDRWAKRNAIGYVHFRNVRGQTPRYHEVFVDEGDVDMARLVGILNHNNFDGVLIPDHTPQMTCSAPWHAGMAYAMGYMRALLDQYSDE